MSKPAWRRAEILYAVIAGSKLNGFFRPDIDLAHGKDLFHQNGLFIGRSSKI